MEFHQKIKGAVVGRFAGCALGAAVELIGFEETLAYAKKLGIVYPPVNYWPDSPRGDTVRYIDGTFREFTLSKMKYLPADDDIIFKTPDSLKWKVAAQKYGIDIATFGDIVGSA